MSFGFLLTAAWLVSRQCSDPSPGDHMLQQPTPWGIAVLACRCVIDLFKGEASDPEEHPAWLAIRMSFASCRFGRHISEWHPGDYWAFAMVWQVLSQLLSHMICLCPWRLPVATIRGAYTLTPRVQVLQGIYLRTIPTIPDAETLHTL